MSNDGVKALFFDVFGTVVDWRTSIAREARIALSPKGFALDWLAFADSWRAKYQPAMEPIRTGVRGYIRLDDLHRENLVDVLAEFSVTGLPDEEIDHLNTAWHRLDPWPDCVAGMTRLKSKFILGTMSNGNVGLMVKMAKNNGLPWDVILGAEPAQLYKPRLEVYRTGADWLNLDPAECMMVAAHNGDLLSAREAGLKTAFIARPTEYGPNQTHDFKAEHEFEAIADSMIDLADKLGCA